MRRCEIPLSVAALALVLPVGHVPPLVVLGLGAVPHDETPLCGAPDWTGGPAWAPSSRAGTMTRQRMMSGRRMIRPAFVVVSLSYPPAAAADKRAVTLNARRAAAALRVRRSARGSACASRWPAGICARR